MKSTFNRPDWTPRVESGSRILIAGATGGLGRALVGMLLEGSDCVIGAHGSSQTFDSSDGRVVPLSQTFDGEESCHHLVDNFIEQAGGIDALVKLR